MLTDDGTDQARGNFERLLKTVLNSGTFLTSRLDCEGAHIKEPRVGKEESGLGH